MVSTRAYFVILKRHSHHNKTYQQCFMTLNASSAVTPFLRVNCCATRSLTHFEENPRPQLRTPRGWDDPRVRSAIRPAGAARSGGGPMKHIGNPVCTNRWDGQKGPPRSAPDNIWGGDVRVRVVRL